MKIFKKSGKIQLCERCGQVVEAVVEAVVAHVANALNDECLCGGKGDQDEDEYDDGGGRGGSEGSTGESGEEHHFCGL